MGAAAVASRPTSSWGFSSRQQGEQMIPDGVQQMKSSDGLSRPHTAGTAGLVRPGGGGMGGTQIDPRKHASVDQGEGEGVVASARALMRYRRTRASTADGSMEKSWTGGDGQPSTSMGAPRITVYQNPSKAPQQGKGGLGSGWMGGDRPKSAGIASSGAGGL